MKYKVNRGKTAEFSAENSLFDMGLLAAQSGKEIEYASKTAYNVPYMDEITVSAENAAANKITLAHKPADDTDGKGVAHTTLSVVGILNGDGTLGTKFTIATSGTAEAGKVVLSAANKTLTFAAGVLKAGMRIFAFYDFEAGGTDEDAAQVVNTAIDFPTAGRFVMEVLGVDVCDTSVLYSAYIEFPNSRMLADFDLSFATDSTHPFTIRAMQDYCDPENRLFRIVVPETATTAKV